MPPDPLFFGSTSAFARLLRYKDILSTHQELPQSTSLKETGLTNEILSFVRLDTSEYPLRYLADRLATLYCQSIEKFHPILGSQAAYKIVDLLYHSNGGDGIDACTKMRFNLILSVALSLLIPSDVSLGVLARTYFRKAMTIAYTNDLLITPSIPALEALILVSINAWLDPSILDSWRILGHASRMCLDMMEMKMLDEESARVNILYRILYTLETQIMVAFGRPRQLPELSVTPSDQSFPHVDSLALLRYDLARQQNRFHRDLMGDETVSPDVGLIAVLPDTSWMESRFFEMYTWSERWRASVEALLNDYPTINGTGDDIKTQLLNWGQFQQAEALLLAKVALDKRGKTLVSDDEEYSLCKRLIWAADTIHRETLAIGSTPLSHNSAAFIFPLPWTSMHSIFIAGIILVRHMNLNGHSDRAAEEARQKCMSLIQSLEVTVGSKKKGLSECLQKIISSSRTSYTHL